MGNRYASGHRAISECDRCGFRFKLKTLKELVVKLKPTGLLVCSTCWDADHPQLLLGMYPVDDPQALRRPRPDHSYVTAGIAPDGSPSMGSRQIAWGWNPVGGGNYAVSGGTPNPLAMRVYVGSVTVVTL